MILSLILLKPILFAPASALPNGDLFDISLCSGAEYLLQIVHKAIPKVFFESSAAITSADLAVHVLDNLYKKLDEVCLIQNGQVERTIVVCITLSFYFYFLTCSYSYSPS